ncbi:MAG: SMP-30/gluconolactonase/LRE family protein [Candidatus Brocadiae bacterium]|nr:SMP-30/gluconolactonase/LRE family protein [Candidatus Brocadiia bacterium]
MKSIIEENAKPKMLGEQFQFTEGPLWLPKQEMWIFSDIPGNKIYQYHPEKGFAIFRDPSNFTNGHALDLEGNLISAQHNRTVTRTKPDGSVEVIADKYNGKKLNSPNDLAVSKKGEIYFTDPHYGLIGYGPVKAEEEQPVRGIYRLRKDGTVELLCGDLKIPNGVAFSPKESTLYVTNAEDGNIYCFDVQVDGTLDNLRLFAKQPVREGKNPVGDGIRVDKSGNVYAAFSGGIAIYNVDGKLLGEIALPESATNLAWGGKDYKTLFITAQNKVYAIDTRIGG